VLWLRAEREMEGREATDPSLKRRDFAHVRRTLLFLFLFAPVFSLPSICFVSSSLRSYPLEEDKPRIATTKLSG
jgi:hypothetical protein